MATRKSKLGPYLEWHGASIRVQVRVPKSKRELVGKPHIKVPLYTSDPVQAEMLKGPVVARIKAELEGVRVSRDDAIQNGLEKALMWRKAIKEHSDTADAVHPRDVLIEGVIEPLLAKGRENEAEQFLAVADGRATPIQPMIDDWIAANLYDGRTEEKARHALKVLQRWCDGAGLLCTFEAVDRAAAAAFVHDTYIRTKTNSVTANVHISWITRFWKWAKKTSRWSGENFWPELRINEQIAKRMGQVQYEKRPFTDDEVKKLMEGLSPGVRDGDRTMLDFITVAALSGMRRGEIGALTVGDVRNDCFYIQGGKTDAAKRVVPIHSALKEIVAARTADKLAEAYLFDDLPGAASDRRDRADTLGKRFGRYRSKLGIGEKGANSRQDSTDMHSFRRWFIDKAQVALAQPDCGFTGWTVADVVGHSKEEGPLGMTFGRYPGRAPIEQLRACVEAVTLPDVVGLEKLLSSNVSSNKSDA